LLPFVSVIVPTYNNETTIDQLIQSLLRLDYPEEKIEIIMVDNNSRDRTPVIIQKYLPRVILVHQRKYQSAYAARNRGIEVAHGEIIAFTDGDCWVPSHWLKSLLKKYDQAEFVAFGGEYLPARVKTLVERYLAARQFQSLSTLRDTKPYPYLLGGNMAFRREVFEKLGLFHPEQITGGDVEIAWRIQFKLNKKIAFEPTAFVYHYHPSQIKKLVKQWVRIGQGNIYLQKYFPQLKTSLFKESTKYWYNFFKFSLAGVKRYLLFRPAEVDYFYFDCLVNLCAWWGLLTGLLNRKKLLGGKDETRKF
jgi:glycosyltransferase involved in cell wall biosynthesis